MALSPPVSATNGIVLPSDPSRSAIVFWISRATAVDPVNITAAHRGFRDEQAADLACTGQELHGRRWGRRPAAAAPRPAPRSAASPRRVSPARDYRPPALPRPVRRRWRAGNSRGLMQTTGPERPD